MKTSNVICSNGNRLDRVCVCEFEVRYAILRYTYDTMHQFSFDTLPLALMRICPTKVYHIAKCKVRKIEPTETEKETEKKNGK